MAGPTAKTPVWRTKDYDGNGKLSATEIAQGKKIVNGKVVGAKNKLTATIQDSSASKQMEEVANLKSENTDLKKNISKYLDLVKDLESRVRKMEDGK